MPQPRNRSSLPPGSHPSRARRAAAPALALLAACGGMLAPPVQAVVLYQTGFESPPFSPGALTGQDSWFSDFGASFVTVQSSVVASGAQAVAISATGAPNFTRGVRFVGPHDTATDDPIVLIEVDAYIASAASQSYWHILDAFYSSGSVIGGVQVDSAGEVTANAVGAGSTGVFVAFDTWNRFGVRVDFASQTFDILLNGATVYAGAGMGGTFESSFGAVAVSSAFFNATDTAYFDNLSITTEAATTVPEPSTLALIALALAGIGSRRRRS